MIAGETQSLEIQILDDGAVRARRKDRNRLTDADWEEAYSWAGIEEGAVSKVRRLFPGVIVENAPLFCRACDKDLIPEYGRIEATATTKELAALLAKRRGKMIERIWPDERREWACHYCGREIQT